MNKTLKPGQKVFSPDAGMLVVCACGKHYIPLVREKTPRSPLGKEGAYVSVCKLEAAFGINDPDARVRVLPLDEFVPMPPITELCKEAKS